MKKLCSTILENQVKEVLGTIVALQKRITHKATTLFLSKTILLHNLTIQPHHYRFSKIFVVDSLNSIFDSKIGSDPVWLGFYNRELNR